MRYTKNPKLRITSYNVCYTKLLRASDMISGTIIVTGDTGKFLGAKRKGGKIYAKTGSSVPPTKKYDLNSEDKNFLGKQGFFGDFIKFE